MVAPVAVECKFVKVLNSIRKEPVVFPLRYQSKFEFSAVAVLLSNDELLMVTLPEGSYTKITSAKLVAVLLSNDELLMVILPEGSDT